MRKNLCGVLFALWVLSFMGCSHDDSPSGGSATSTTYNGIYKVGGIMYTKLTLSSDDTFTLTSNDNKTLSGTAVARSAREATLADADGYTLTTTDGTTLTVAATKTEVTMEKDSDQVGVGSISSTTDSVMADLPPSEGENEFKGKTFEWVMEDDDEEATDDSSNKCTVTMSDTTGTISGTVKEKALSMPIKYAWYNGVGDEKEYKALYFVFTSIVDFETFTVYNSMEEALRGKSDYEASQFLKDYLVPNLYSYSIGTDKRTYTLKNMPTGNFNESDMSFISDGAADSDYYVVLSSRGFEAYYGNEGGDGILSHTLYFGVPVYVVDAGNEAAGTVTIPIFEGSCKAGTKDDWDYEFQSKYYKYVYGTTPLGIIKGTYTVNLSDDDNTDSTCKVTLTDTGNINGFPLAKDKEYTLNFNENFAVTETWVAQ